MSGDFSFDAHAESYEQQCMAGLALSGEPKEFFARLRVAFLREWWNRSGRPEPARIVDYGCGVGDVTTILAEAFPTARVEGLDPSARCIARAAARRNSENVRFSVLRRQTLRQQTLRQQTEGDPVDLVHVNGVVHHVQPDQRRQFFASLQSLVKPRGVVALFENNPLNPGTRLVMSRIPFDEDAIPVYPWQARRHLREAGLTRVCTSYLFFFPRFLGMLRPLEALLVRVPLGAQYAMIAVRGERA